MKTYISTPPDNVKVYRALLTQSGTDAPAATVLENTLGGTVVWTYSDVGIYLGTLTGAFTENKTFGMIGNTFFASTDVLSLNLFSRTDADVVQVNSRSIDLTSQPPIEINNTNDFLSATRIEILVYP